MLEKLSAAPLEKRMKPGLHFDGGGLCLRVKTSSTGKEGKFWIFRYKPHGKKWAKEMGLGPLHTVSLSEARKKAGQCRKLLKDGLDPIQQRDLTAAQARLKAARNKTFRECAKAYIEAHEAEWHNPKHIQQWKNTLETYVYEVFGDLSVQDIDTTLIMKVLEPIWKEKRETASRLRGRIELVLDWATTSKYRKGDNPARWRGHLEHLLAKKSKEQKAKHHPALPYDHVNEFISKLKVIAEMASRALQLTIYTACRTSEVIGARWEEVDLKNKTWTIPADRIKAGKEHRVPLSNAVLEIFESQFKIRTGDWVFPGRSLKKPMSNMAMLQLLKRIQRREITVHGFRSSFRDWAAEQTNFPREVAEAALAHVVGDVEAAYRRSDLFNKRRLMMDAWAKYCNTPPSKRDNKIISIRYARSRMM